MHLLAFVVVAATLLPVAAWAQTQNLGHHLPGGVGLDAGVQNDEGVFMGFRLVRYHAGRINDRDGDPLPVPELDIVARAAVIGLSGTFKLDGLPYLSAAVAAPVVRFTADSGLPEAGIDRLALGDVFVEPLKLGWRSSRADVVGSYSFEIPTNQGARLGIGRSQWAHQLSAGGAVFFDDVRGWRASVLASYVLHQQKRGVDITRGDTVLVQGGIGGRVLGVVDLGLAGYGLWQVTDDRGADLPPGLRGLRERVFGLGPELDYAIPSLRARLSVRYEWDLGARSRPQGQLLVVSLAFVTWRPGA